MKTKTFEFLLTVKRTVRARDHDEAMAKIENSEPGEIVETLAYDEFEEKEHDE